MRMDHRRITQAARIHDPELDVVADPGAIVVVVHHEERGGLGAREIRGVDVIVVM